MSCGSDPNGGIQSRIYVALLVLIAAPFARAEPADIVFLNGRIHTQDAKGQVVEALAVIRNDIAAVGNDRKIRRFTGPHTRIIDLDGKTVLPGFIDAHTHPAESAQELGKCGLDDAPLDLRTVQAKVAVCLAQNPGVPPEWFEVVQVNPSGLILSRRNLDAMLADRPMLFSGSDGHTVWVNTEALRAAGISSATPDPPGGRIERDSSGNPTGTLRDNATELALQKMPRPSIETEANRLARALGAMRADGITSVQDASVDAHLMSIYKFLYDKHQLLMRVRGCFHLVNLKADPASLIEEAKRFRAAWG